MSKETDNIISERLLKYYENLIKFDINIIRKKKGISNYENRN